MTTLKQIDKAIASFTTNGDKLNKQGHAVAMMILNHAKQHGDCTRALALVKAMPASMRRTMMIAWFAKFSPIAVKLGDTDAVGFNAKYLALKTADAKANAWDIVGADAEPFYLMAEKEPENKELTLVQLLGMIQSIGKRITAKREGGKIAANDADKVAEIEAKLAALAA